MCTATTGTGTVRLIPYLMCRWAVVYVGPPESAFAVELSLLFPAFEPLIRALPREYVLGRVRFMG